MKFQFVKMQYLLKAVKWIIIKWGIVVFCKHHLCTVGNIRSGYQLTTARPPTVSVQNPFIHRVIVHVLLLLFASPFKPFLWRLLIHLKPEDEKVLSDIDGSLLKSSDLSKARRKTELLWFYFVMSELSLGEWRQSQSQRSHSMESPMKLSVA